MPRLPRPSRENFDEDLRRVFDEVSGGGPGSGDGPMSILTNSPEMARRAVPLFDYVRNESSLPWKLRELAMLTTARALDCQYIWNAHASLGREAGLSNQLVDALREKLPLPELDKELALELDKEEKAVLDLGREFFTTHRVSRETFDSALELFGAQGLVELTTLMGFYAMLAFNANAVDLGLPHPGPEPPLPV